MQYRTTPARGAQYILFLKVNDIHLAMKDFFCRLEWDRVDVKLAMSLSPPTPDGTIWRVNPAFRSRPASLVMGLGYLVAPWSLMPASIQRGVVGTGRQWSSSEWSLIPGGVHVIPRESKIHVCGIKHWESNMGNKENKLTRFEDTMWDWGRKSGTSLLEGARDQSGAAGLYWSFLANEGASFWLPGSKTADVSMHGMKCTFASGTNLAYSL